jgi:Fe2+ or Zn2+ uptake regulation protein
VEVTASELLDALRRSNLRITASRRAICEILAADHHSHLTAGELLERVNQQLGAKVAPSTIYRTIDALEAEGLVRHLHLGAGPAVLHLAEDSTHHHLVCESCGRTVDIDTGAFDTTIGLVAKRNHFVPETVHYALLGRCEACVAKIAN